MLTCSAKVKEAEDVLGVEQGKVEDSISSDIAKQQLPPGWERKLEPKSQRVFYVNRITKTTQWELPTSSLWRCAGCGYDENLEESVECILCQVSRQTSSGMNNVSFLC